jgi:hypothetical protein
MLFRSYISPVFPCLVISAPEDGDSIFLRNIGIVLQNPHGTKTRDFNNNLLSRIVEVKMWKTIILPVVLYGRETWPLTLREEHRLEGV